MEKEETIYTQEELDKMNSKEESPDIDWNEAKVDPDSFTHKKYDLDYEFFNNELILIIARYVREFQEELCPHMLFNQVEALIEDSKTFDYNLHRYNKLMEARKNQGMSLRDEIEVRYTPNGRVVLVNGKIRQEWVEHD